MTQVDDPSVPVKRLARNHNRSRGSAIGGLTNTSSSFVNLNAFVGTFNCSM